MNIREAAMLLGAGAVAVRYRRGDIPALPVTKFRRLIEAAKDDPSVAGPALRLSVDGGNLLNQAAGARRPRPSAPYARLADIVSDVLRDTARAGELVPADAGLCPCITVRLWHPAIALACALITTPNDDVCPAVLEAMSA